MLDDATEVGEASTQAGAAAHAPSRAREPDRGPTLERGAAVGRYLVLGRIGRGGMGEVFAAHDPELDRKIALKLLHARRGEDDETLGRTRMVREAQAMARLNHPNTITVHDVGEHQGRVFLAMEFVEGQTLGAWLAESVRTWREIVAVFAAAGRGLAAAHGVGLVHRDFKPENVMLTRSGRVLVMDFGLARAGTDASGEFETAGGEADAPLAAMPRSSSGAQLSTAVTQAGALIGTPAYMAPEQLRGEVVDARSDQWAFCVSLWEALYGERPFPTASLAELMYAVLEGSPRSVPRGSHVPGWLHRVVVRGLARDPAQRWSSLDQLLAALEQIPRRRRRLALGLGLAGLLGALSWSLLRPPAPEPPLCQEGDETIASSWNDEVRGQVGAALLASKAPYAGDTASTVARELDAWRDEWVEAYRDNCEDTALRGEQSAALLDRRMHCLTDRRTRFDALVTTLREQGDELSVVETAVQRVQSLPDIARCNDVAYVEARIPPPDDPAAASEVERIQARLARLDSKAILDANEQSELAALLPVAEQIGHGPLTAELQCELGRRRGELGDFEGARERLRGGYFLARRLGDPDMTIFCGISLLSVLVGEGGLPTEALAFAEHVEPDVLRSGSVFDRASLDNVRGLAQHATGDYAGALRSFEAALALWQGGRTTEMQTNAHLNLGRTLRARGDWDEARVELEDALDGVSATHPTRALVLDQLGLLDSQIGQLEAAERHFAAALAVRVGSLPASHPQLANSHTNLGRVLDQRSRPLEALDHFEKAQAIWIAQYGAHSIEAARGHANLGVALRQLGRREEAREHYEQAEALYEELLGPDHDDLAIALHNLANLLVQIGEPEPARELQERALGIWTRKLGRSHIFVAHGSIGLADALVSLGELEPAIAAAERGLDVLDRSGSSDPELELAGLVTLARAELAAGRRDAAREHVERALERIAALPLGPDVTLQRARARRVLAELEPARRAELLDAAAADYASLPGDSLPEAGDAAPVDRDP